MPFQQVLDEPADFRRAMLPIAVDLNRYFIAMQCSKAISGLHRPANTEIKWQAHNRHARRHLPDGVIG